jgi:phage repressor protein C with HTH and peptisase S24 domain
MGIHVAIEMEKNQTDRTKGLGERVRRAREAIGMSQETLAKLIGVTQQSVQSLEAGIHGTRSIHRYAQALNQSIAWLDAGEGEMREPADAGAEVSPTTPALGDVSAFTVLPRDVPIMGVAQGGGEDESFVLNMGEIVNYAKRLPSIARNNRVFALYVQGSSMEKWRQPGGIVYLDPSRPPKAGDHVVVEFNTDELGNGSPALLKLFLGTTPTKIKLRQYNPEKSIEVPLSKVRKIHRVIEWEELIS